MWHTVFIALHAVAGSLSLLAGCVAIRGRALFGTYFWALVAMEVLLVLAIAAEWPALTPPTRLLFGVLALLGVFMVWRADKARRIRPSGSEAPSARFVAHVGFTLIALFDAFIVVLILNRGASGPLIAVVGVLIAVAGHFALVAVRRRIVDGADSPRETTAP